MIYEACKWRRRRRRRRWRRKRRRRMDIISEASHLTQTLRGNV